jgi:hypothetical protein
LRFEFAADLLRENLREKDLEPISLDVIDEADATRKLFFRGFVTLERSGLWPGTFSSRRMFAELLVKA